MDTWRSRAADDSWLRVSRDRDKRGSRARRKWCTWAQFMPEDVTDNAMIYERESIENRCLLLLIEYRLPRFVSVWGGKWQVKKNQADGVISCNPEDRRTTWYSIGDELHPRLTLSTFAHVRPTHFMHSFSWVICFYSFPLPAFSFVLLKVVIFFSITVILVTSAYLTFIRHYKDMKHRV